MKIWFTSDHHFFHTNVIRYCGRPYATVEEMNEKLVANWNSVVGPDDIVYHIGDFSMAIRPVETFTKRLMGKKILVAGNHDWVHPAHKKSRNPENQAKWIQTYKHHGWDEVIFEKDLQIPGVANVRLMHMPYLNPDPKEEQRHNKHRIPDDGRILLCGHVHEKWHTRRTPKGTLMINVGVDVNNFTPVSLETIIELIATTP